MKTRNILHILASTALVASLSACGGGGGGMGGGNESVRAPIAPMKDMSVSDYQALQARGVIAQDGEETQFVSLASTDTSTAPFNGPVGRRDGSLSIAAGETTDGEVTRNPGMTFRTGAVDTGSVSFHPDYTDYNGVSGDASEAVNGEGVYLGRVDSDAQSTTVVYIPRGDSNMYAGGYASDIDGIRAFHGVFGRVTTQDEMSRIKGTARYSGVGAASVERDGNTMAESGFYEGATTAEVNFDTNGFTMQGEFARDRNYSAGTDTMTMDVAQGTFDQNGRLAGAATYGGVDAGGTAVTGDVDGRFFGPGAESMGATFIGSGNNGSGGYANVVGHTVLNKD